MELVYSDVLSAVPKKGRRMNTTTKTVNVQKMFFEELPSDEQELLKKAFAVRSNAQAPYSNYLVGVAIVSDQETVHVGCNVERCTWTQTTHAEQNAIDTMIASIGPSKLLKVAVVGAAKDAQFSLTTSAAPINNLVCGHCLQLIWENSCEDPNVKILNLESNGIVACTTIADLLPFRFGPENLNVYYQNKADRITKGTQ